MLPIAVAVFALAAPPLAPGAHKALTQELSTSDVVADVDVSAAAQLLRNAGCHKARFSVIHKELAWQRPGTDRFVVDARALGFDHKGQPCAHDVVIDVGFRRRANVVAAK